MTKVAMIGLGFGAEFIPIYQAYPGAHVHAICRRNEAELNKVGDEFGIDHRYTRFEDVLADPEVDYAIDKIEEVKQRAHKQDGLLYDAKGHDL